jgi:hypothetical protein
MSKVEKGKPSTDVAAPSKTAVGQVIDFSQDAGAGLEGADKDSFAIPFLTVLQPLSPIVVEEAVPGAKAGLFMNTVTNELRPDVLIVPCSFQRRFLRWQPREKGGGYKGEFNPADVETGKVEGLQVGPDDGRYYIGGTNPKEHDQLKDTRNHYILILNPETGGFTPALLSLASTQIKKSKRLLSRIQGIQMKKADGSLFTPPSWSHIYKVRAVLEQNDQGKWYGVEFDMHGPVDDPQLYAAGKAFYEQVSAGKIKIGDPTPDVADETDPNGKF